MEEVKAAILGASADGGKPREAGSASAEIMRIAEEKYRFGVTDAGEVFATPVAGPRIAHMLRGGRVSLRSQLAREYHQRSGKVATQQALTDVLATIDGVALDREPTPLFLRVGEHEGALYLDLGRPDGQAVRVADGVWSTEATVPVLFKRTPLTGAMPQPVRGGSLDELWKWVNVQEVDRPLVLAFLVASFWPSIAHPVLGVFGQQGSGKTTAMRTLVALVDPGPVPVRKPPRDQDAWIVAANGSWLVAIDNVSTVQEWLSDALCRACTGDGDIRRRLYTDGDVHAFSFRRVVLMTGIDLGALPGDLADRLVPVTLHVITERSRRDETTMGPEWAAAHPRILGALLDLVAHVHKALTELPPPRLPRMADFGRILHALDVTLGISSLDRYLGVQGNLAADSLTGDPFITRLVECLRTAFEGTSAELLAMVTPADVGWRPPKDWPTTPRRLTQLLHRQAPVLRKAGWQVHDDAGSNKGKSIRWTLVPPAPGLAQHGAETTVLESEPGSLAGLAGVAGDASAASLVAAAAEVLDELRLATIEDLRERYADAVSRLSGRSALAASGPFRARAGEEPLLGTAAITLFAMQPDDGRDEDLLDTCWTAVRRVSLTE